MGTWGPGLFMNDTAQDFLDELNGIGPEARIEKVRAVLDRVAADPATIMRVYTVEEVVVAAAIIAATLQTNPDEGWLGDSTVRDIIATMEPQHSLADTAARALGAAVDHNDSWFIRSLKSEDDRQTAVRELHEVRDILSGARP